MMWNRDYRDAVKTLTAENRMLREENQRMRNLLGDLGFCTTHGESMPCLTCGVGL